MEDASYHSHPNLKDNASLSQCEHEEPGSATVETAKPFKNLDEDAMLNLCENEHPGFLTGLANWIVREENLEYNPSLKQHEHLLLRTDGMREYPELTKETHILSFNDDTTNRDMGGNLIARRAPRCRQGRAATS